MYIIKGGGKRDTPTYPDSFHPKLPTVVHAVFNWEPHGTAYAAISPSVGPLVVPHMVVSGIKLEQSLLRQVLSIPDKALVVCRHGGLTTFSIQMAKDAVVDLVSKYDERKLHFLFLGTNEFTPSSRQIHYLAATSSLLKKEQFFAACDVMLHARADGETFGLAVGEMSVRNKPVITHWVPGGADCHIKILGDKGFYYKSRVDVIKIVSDFVEHGVPERDFNAYRDYTPEKVMTKFKRIFLDPVFGQ